nr:MAG TPA: hypothetical protein [Caudoviricetes sp.]
MSRVTGAVPVKSAAVRTEKGTGTPKHTHVNR